jgi:hypothetical protein
MASGPSSPFTPVFLYKTGKQLIESPRHEARQPEGIMVPDPAGDPVCGLLGHPKPLMTPQQTTGARHHSSTSSGALSATPNGKPSVGAIMTP